MDSSQYLAIGDIHGCARTLDALTHKITSYHDHVHVFIGDYIDRGPDSRGVIDQLNAFSKEYHCVFIRGNHEKMLLDALQKKNEYLWFMNGGINTLASYGVSAVEEIPRDHLDFITATQLWYDTPEYLFIHAGLDPDRSIEEQFADHSTIEDAVLWKRNHIDASTNWEKTVVFGHTPVAEPFIDNQKIGIDTGCVYRHEGLGMLTAALLPEKSFIQQKCLD